MKRVLLLAVAGVLVLAAIAAAANREGQISISPIIGGYTYDSSQGRDSSVNPIYGVRAGYNFTRNLGIEGLFDYVTAEHPDNSGEIDMVRYGGELLYHFFPDNVLVPYLAAGYSGVKFDGSGIDRDIHGAFDYGAGLKYFMNDSFALRLDFRHLLYSMDGRTNSNLEYTLGAYIPLNAGKPAVKPVEPPPAPPEAAPVETDLSAQDTFTSLTAETQTEPLGRILVYGLKVVDNMIEFIATESIKDYKIFTLTEPSRLVIDIPDAVSGFMQENISIDKLGISVVRFENNPGYLRIFLDATQWRILPYRVEEADKSLKIIITTP
jgi:outer membrane beta-barrel protein